LDHKKNKIKKLQSFIFNKFNVKGWNREKNLWEWDYFTKKKLKKNQEAKFLKRWK